MQLNFSFPNLLSFLLISSLFFFSNDSSAYPQLISSCELFSADVSVEVNLPNPNPNAVIKGLWDLPPHDAPDIIACFNSGDNFLGCYPNNLNTFKACHNSFSCNFSISLPLSSFTITIFDHDSSGILHSDLIGTGECYLDKVCSIGSSMVQIRSKSNPDLSQCDSPEIYPPSLANPLWGKDR